jgi:hypothetical protein
MSYGPFYDFDDPPCTPHRYTTEGFGQTGGFVRGHEAGEGLPENWLPHRPLCVDTDPTVQGILGQAIGEAEVLLEDIQKYFGNLLKFLGELDPLSPLFDPLKAAESFLNLVLLPTKMLAPLVTDAAIGLGLEGFVPMENLDTTLLTSAIGGTLRGLWASVRDI